MSEIEDAIVRDSDKSFRLRIAGFLRSAGISQITGTKEYLDIDFVGGEVGVRVIYPRKLEAIDYAIEKALLLETELSRKQIDNIKLYVKDCVDEIEKAIKELKV